MDWVRWRLSDIFLGCHVTCVKVSQPKSAIRCLPNFQPSLQMSGALSLQKAALWISSSKILWCHLLSQDSGSHPIPLSLLLFLDCHKETTWLQHFESELEMTTEEAALHFLNDRKNQHCLKHFSHSWLENRNDGITWKAATRNYFPQVLPSPKHCSAPRESTWMGVKAPWFSFLLHH